SHQLAARLRTRTDPETARDGRRGSRSRPEAAGSRRRPLILAASAAAIVLVAGMMWPDGQESEPADAATSAVEHDGRRAAGEPRTEPSEAPEPDASDMPDAPAEPAPEQPAPEDADDAL